MNFKKTALVLAMAGVVATPITAQAAAGEGAYASIRIGLQVKTNGGANTFLADGTTAVTGPDVESTTISGLASRFGFKSSTDLGNGMTGFGQYEFGVNTEETAGDTANSPVTRVRKAFAGIKGDFGSLHVGTGYNTFYSHAVGVNDSPWWGSGYAMVAYRGRTSNNLTYAGSADSLSYGVTLQMDDSGKTTTGDQEVIDALELGLSYDAGFGKFGFGYLAPKADKSDVGSAAIPAMPAVDAVAATGIGTPDYVPGTPAVAAVAAVDAVQPTTDDPEPIIGLALSGIAAGPVTLGFGYQTQDPSSSILLDVGFNNVYLHYEALTSGATGGIGDKTSLAIGYTKSFGPQTSAFFEYHVVAEEAAAAAGNAGDLTAIRAIMKYDI